MDVVSPTWQWDKGWEIGVAQKRGNCRPLISEDVRLFQCTVHTSNSGIQHWKLYITSGVEYIINGLESTSLLGQHFSFFHLRNLMVFVIGFLKIKQANKNMFLEGSIIMTWGFTISYMNILIHVACGVLQDENNKWVSLCLLLFIN